METYELQGRQITLIKDGDHAVLKDHQVVRGKKGTKGAWVEFRIAADGTSTIKTERVPLTFAFVISQRQAQFKAIVVAGAPAHPYESLKKWLDSKAARIALNE